MNNACQTYRSKEMLYSDFSDCVEDSGSVGRKAP